VKAITSLPSDITLITLPAGPLLELVCLAAQRQLTAMWLSLAAILIAQLNPPVISLSLKSGPTPEAEMTIQRLLPVLLQCSLTFLMEGGALEIVSTSALLIFLLTGLLESRHRSRVFWLYGPGELHFPNV
jgi:hypothetical protein